MKYLEGFSAMRDHMKENDIPTEQVGCDMLPSQLYELLGEIEGTDLMDPEKLEKCKIAIHQRNLEGVKDNMPKEIYGIEINLVLP